VRISTLAASLISAGLATVITAKVVETVLEKEFEERLERELTASVEFLEETGKAEPTEEYQEKHKQVFGTKFDLEKPPLDELAKNEKVRYDQIVKSYTSSKDVVTDEEGKTMIDGVEVCDTLPDIHAISTDEYMENESGFLQSTLTYCADGGVLDEDGDLVVDHVDMIGNAIPPFGQLSGEPHVVYLRNTKTRREYEVIQDEANAADILADPSEVP